MKKIALLVCLLAACAADAQDFRLRGPGRSARLLSAGAVGSTLTLSSTFTSTATGSTNAIVLDWNARISWGGSGTYLTSTGAGDIRAPFGVSFTLVGGTFQADNMRSANGTGLTLKGSAVNTSDNLIINSAGVALTTGDIMVWQNNGVEKASLASDGTFTTAGLLKADNYGSANGVGVFLVGSAVATTDNLTINTQGVSLTTGKLVVVKNNGNEKVSIASDGAITTTVGVRLNTLGGGSKPTCDSSIRGSLWYVQGGAGVADTFEACTKDAADAYAWRTLY